MICFSDKTESFSKKESLPRAIHQCSVEGKSAITETRITDKTGWKTAVIYFQIYDLQCTENKVTFQRKKIKMKN